MGLLDGKVALITGAARGIGKAIAMKFASEGADVAFTDLVINEAGEQTVKDIEAFGHKVKAYASNAANFEETHNVVNQILADFGRIDILVNNAGITKDGLMLRMTEAQWDAVLNVNLKSAFNFIHAREDEASSTCPLSLESQAMPASATTPHPKPVSSVWPNPLPRRWGRAESEPTASRRDSSFRT